MILLFGARFCFWNPWSWLILEDIGNLPQTEWTSNRQLLCLLIFARTSSRSYGVFVSYKTWSCLIFQCSSLDLALSNFSVPWFFLLDMVALDLVSYIPPRREVPVGPLPSAKANWVCPFCPHIWPSSGPDFPFQALEEWMCLGHTPVRWGLHETVPGSDERDRER